MFPRVTGANFPRSIGGMLGVCTVATSATTPPFRQPRQRQQWWTWRGSKTSSARTGTGALIAQTLLTVPTQPQSSGFISLAHAQASRGGARRHAFRSVGCAARAYKASQHLARRAINGVRSRDNAKGRRRTRVTFRAGRPGRASGASGSLRSRRATFAAGSCRALCPGLALRTRRPLSARSWPTERNGGSASDLLQIGVNRSGSQRRLRGPAFLRTLGIELSSAARGDCRTRTIRTTAVGETQSHDTVSRVSDNSDGHGAGLRDSPNGLRQALTILTQISDLCSEEEISPAIGRRVCG